MTVWYAASLALWAGLLPCAWIARADEPFDRLVALEMASTLSRWRW
jgi:hypothetical protein